MLSSLDAMVTLCNGVKTSQFTFPVRFRASAYSSLWKNNKTASS